MNPTSPIVSAHIKDTVNFHCQPSSVRILLVWGPRGEGLQSPSGSTLRKGPHTARESNMANKTYAFEEITPQQLIPAVKHIYDSFNESDWKCSLLTKKLCYLRLHPESANSISLAPYQAAFQKYKTIIGQPAAQRFDELLRIGTPPAIFRAYLDAYKDGLKVEIHTQFEAILEIGFANRPLLRTSPVQWSGSHLTLLIDNDIYRVRSWIRGVCDKEDYSSVDLDSLEDFEQSRFWREWRAPSLIYMHPAGSAPYDAATAWVREDERRTQELLDNRSRRFTQFLKIYLRHLVGEAHVSTAKSDWLARSSASQAARTKDGDLALANLQTPVSERTDCATPRSSRDGRRSRSESGAGGSFLLSDYRSEAKRAVLIQLTKNPHATDLEICRKLDADGSIDLPMTWKPDKGERSFVQAYLNEGIRHRIEIMISKVRADLRRQRLLPPH
jgi:hypothetical protein